MRSLLLLPLIPAAAAGASQRALRAHPRRQQGARQLADLLARLHRPALFAAGPDQHRQRRQAAHRLDAPGGRAGHFRDLADRGRWHALHHRAAQRGGGARRGHGPHCCGATERIFPNDLRLCCGKVNRGLAILGDTRLLRQHRRAPDRARRAHRRLRWDVTMADYKSRLLQHRRAARREGQDHHRNGGRRVSASRGFIDAYDAKTGKRAWRFNTIPAKGEPGQRNLGRRELEDRLGHHLGDRRLRSRNQYGLLGHRQSRARLERRRAQGRQPLLGLPDRARSRYRRQEMALPVHAARHERLGFHADADRWWMAWSQGQPRKMVVLANRNGFYYALDRITGKFIAGRPYVKQTWASGLDEAGRPMRVARGRADSGRAR